MNISTTDSVPGRRITATKGLALGSTVRAKHVGKDLAAGLKSIVGGELKGYSEKLNETSEESLSRMIAHAQELGADSVIGFRFMASNIAGGASEILTYGTAVTTEIA